MKMSSNLMSVSQSFFNDTIFIVDNILYCSGKYTTVLCVPIILALLNAVNCPPFWCNGNGHPRRQTPMVSLLNISTNPLQLM